MTVSFSFNKKLVKSVISDSEIPYSKSTNKKTAVIVKNITI